MAITPLTGFGPGVVAGAGSVSAKSTPTNDFASIFKKESHAAGLNVRTENAPQTLSAQPKPAHTAIEKAPCVESTTRTVSGIEGTSADRMLARVDAAQHRMDEILKLAESGKSFSPAELLSLQTHVYRASQELDLAGKVVEKATSGVKQVLQTQV